MGEIFLIASLSSFLCFKPGARNLLENEKEGETGNKMHHTRCWMGETETLPSPHHLAPTAASSGWSFGDRGSFILNESQRFNYHLEMGILITEMKLFCNEKWLEDLFHQ